MLRRIQLFLLGLLTFGSSKAEAAKPTPAEIMSEMRLKWLTSSATNQTTSNDVKAVIVDFPMSGVIVTILASSDGDGSLYTTSTFGVLGGIGHENVRRAASELIKVGEKYREAAKVTADFSRPDQAHVKMFVVMEKEVRSYEFPFSGDIPNETIQREIMVSANEMMTQLRLITQK